MTFNAISRPVQAGGVAFARVNCQIGIVHVPNGRHLGSHVADDSDKKASRRLAVRDAWTIAWSVRSVIDTARCTRAGRSRRHLLIVGAPARERARPKCSRLAIADRGRRREPPHPSEKRSCDACHHAVLARQAALKLHDSGPRQNCRVGRWQEQLCIADAAALRYGLKSICRWTSISSRSVTPRSAW